MASVDSWEHPKNEVVCHFLAVQNVSLFPLGFLCHSLSQDFRISKNLSVVDSLIMLLKIIDCIHLVCVCVCVCVSDVCMPWHRYGSRRTNHLQGVVSLCETLG